MTWQRAGPVATSLGRSRPITQPDEGPVPEGYRVRASCGGWTSCIDTEYHQGVDATDSPIDAALGRAGYRATGARRAVVDLITRRDGHFTAADLVDDAQSRGLRIGRATIFRTLDVLTELRAVERLDLPTGDHAYVACEPAHHHHVICSRCGRSSDADDAGLRAVVRDIERQTGYRIDEHRLELFGLCPDCLARGST
ncbi:MAG: ferric uptake regulator, Fur family [Chloroflexota bacterium]|nr:ferric uptake regulator, Fur family [Chloroflexota bacterium]